MSDPEGSDYRNIIRELLEIAQPCNPQHPALQQGDECPEGHKFACGRCDIVHRARKIMDQ
jgi:hypothetical protein